MAILETTIRVAEATSVARTGDFYHEAVYSR